MCEQEIEKGHVCGDQVIANMAESFNLRLDAVMDDDDGW